MRAYPVKLSRREREVAELVAEGLSNREVGARLFISERTVEYHVEQIFNKLGFRSRTQIASWITSLGASPPSPHEQSARTNLPVQLTSFIGRVDELNELRRLVEESRLVTLTGPGGIGKTRLALQVAAAGAAVTGDVRLVELAPVADGQLVAQSIAFAAGIAEAPPQPLLETVSDRLAESETLIVLDNCEHLVQAAASASEHLLKRCPRVRILATSREPLKTAGELIWQVPALGVPANEKKVSLQTAENSEAIRLFIDRARYVDPHFQLTGADLHAVVQICRELDGMPLAIELAAARLSVMSPQAILKHLDRRFDLLTGGSRSTTSRHRSLEAALQWSYGLLSDDERILFERLSIFRGSFDFASAEAICGGEGLAEKDVLPVLLGLCERSLVAKLDHPTVQARFRMLETIRHFAAERLGTDQMDRLNWRHAEYFERLATDAFRGSMTAARASWGERLEDDVDNVRSAFDWALMSQPKLALSLAANLEFFWRTRTFLTEGLDRTLAALARVPDQSLLRVQGLSTAARLASLTGRSVESRQFNDESIELARRVSPSSELCWWIGRAGIMLADIDPPAAVSLLQEALAGWVAAPDQNVNQYRLAVLKSDLGWALYALRDLDSAVEYSNQALEVIRNGFANSHVHANILDTLATVALTKGDVSGATTHWRALLNIGLELHDFGKIFLGFHGLGRVAAATGRPVRAMRLLGAADTTFQRSGREVPSLVSAFYEPWKELRRKAADTETADPNWRDGASMSTEEAVDYAFADAD